MWQHLERQGAHRHARSRRNAARKRSPLVRERIASSGRTGERRARTGPAPAARREFRARWSATQRRQDTLFNELTRSQVFVENRFATRCDHAQMVSPSARCAAHRHRRLHSQAAHHLVASFHSTLVEAIEADLLLHVVDAADPDFRQQMLAVDGVLEDIMETPRPTTLVFNKSDLLPDESIAAGLHAEFPDCHVVSARTGDGSTGFAPPCGSCRGKS